MICKQLNKLDMLSYVVCFVFYESIYIPVKVEW